MAEFPSLTQKRDARAPVLWSPFMLMSYWLVGASLLYLLGWSDLFVALRSDTIGFMVIVALIFVVLAVRHPVPTIRQAADPLRLGVPLLFTAYFVGAFVKNNGVPIIQILQGVEYDIYGFGLDGLHVFMLCLSGYYGVRAFRHFLESGRWGSLAVTIWVFVLFIAIVNRSAPSFLAFACALVYLYVRGITLTGFAVIVLLGLCFAYLFGVVGDFRLSHQIEAATGVPGRSDAVVQLARATPAFLDSGLSTSWLWAYMYFVSPIANLNAAFAAAGGRICGISCNIDSVVVHELMPDSIGSRIGAAFDIGDVDKASFLIAPDITASTTFGSPVGGAGMIGGTVMLLVLVVVSVMAVRLLAGTAVEIEGLALLGTLVFFSFFENMISYTSLSGQLIIALVCSQSARIRTVLVSLSSRSKAVVA
ncbi:hypothetical protein [Microbacterium sp. YJN-G]|uniref:hypothetical protein n=1 Tax=Microbacterium sp. YJN-G TaxID=2763257 RepID=UPI0018789816|nr:hypothetical protein [Microbacterium sp. YJN-G]